MFTRLNKQGVQSDTGFVVQSIDRFVIEYREAGRKVSVTVEDGLTKDKRPCVNIDKRAFEKWDGSGARLPSNEQARLLANFTAAMEFQGIAVIVY